jgi:hypothetical protein
MSDTAESVSLKVQVSSLLTEYAALIQQYFVAVNSPKENTPESITERIIQVDAKLQEAVQKSMAKSFQCLTLYRRCE